MSATVDAVALKNFFNTERGGLQSGDSAAILSAEGKQYPVIIHYVNGNYYFPKKN